MYMNAYHKEQGEVRMFEVDARNAIARFPEEWAAEPWSAIDQLPDTSGRGQPKKTIGNPPEEGGDALVTASQVQS